MSLDKEWATQLGNSEDSIVWRNVATWVILPIVNDVLQQTAVDKAEMEGGSSIPASDRAELACEFNKRMGVAMTSERLQAWVSNTLLRAGDRLLVSSIPVVGVVLGSRSAVVSPMDNGGVAIFVNEPLMAIYSFFLQSFFGFYFWNTDEPFSRDHLQGEFARSLVRIGKAVSSGRVEDLEEVRTVLYCPSAPLDGTTSKLTQIMQAFLLLRQYVLVVKGRLSETRLSQLEVAGRGVDRYDWSYSEEHEADRLAFQKLVAVSEDLGSDGSEVALAVGILFKLLELCAVHSSTGGLRRQDLSERWNSLQSLVQLDSGSIAAQLDDAFNMIHSRLLSST